MNEVEDLLAVLGRWWEDPALTGLRRLPASTLAGQVPDRPDPFTQDLSGVWAFRLVDRPTDAPAGWTTADISDGSAWARLTVPGCWTMQHVGDLPQYTNVVMPFAGDPPSVPERNPTGLYRTSFRRRSGWARRRTILNLGAAESCAAVWCNGEFVGVSTDSRLPSEFDVTPHVRAGTNELAVLVTRWSGSTWMEDQDHWYHAGLERRVFLRSVPPVSLADVRLTAGLEPDGSGLLTVNAIVDWGPQVASPPAGYSVRARLGRRTAGPVPVSVLDTTSHVRAHLDAYRHPGPRADLTLVVPGVRQWSHEDPHRYPVTVELCDPSGAVVHAYTAQVGFRSVDVVDAELLLNGAPLLVAGVNRHDHQPVTGKTLTDAELREDVLNIKRCGFNAVRTSHYPPDPVVLDTCDEIGLWVVLEANVETHARLAEMAHDRRFEHQYLERVQRAVHTHWNHPSIMGWSLGNEAGYGAVHDAGAAWVRRTDPSRFVQYEGAVMGRWRGAAFVRDWSTSATDIECPMYAPVERLVEWATMADRGGAVPDKPLILCEYSHAMGNSNGGLADYWAAFEQYRGLQGGFIWDWKDQAFALTTDDGAPYWGYGGVFGDDPNDATFCSDGVVGADGVPHPVVEEHRWLTRPVRTSLVRRTLRVSNRRAFTGIDDLVGRVVVAVDGREVHAATLPRLDVDPGATVSVPLALPGRLPEGEVTVTVRWAQRRPTPWAPVGHVVAWDQAVLDTHLAVDSRRPAPGGSGGDSGGSLDEAMAAIGLRALPELALWRAPLDNDGILVGPFAGRSNPARRWLRWGLDRMTAETQRVRRRGAAWIVTTRWTTGAGHPIEHTQRITPEPDGGVRFDEDVRIPTELDDLPRVGVRFSVPPELDRLQWYGPGRWETMPDRCAAPLGIWTSSVADQWVPYVWPQHHGSHVATRWFELTERGGRGLHADLDGMTFDASQYTTEALTAALTHADLAPSGAVHVHVDLVLRGAGTAACGPDTDVIVGGGRHRFHWRLRPIG